MACFCCGEDFCFQNGCWYTRYNNCCNMCHTIDPIWSSVNYKVVFQTPIEYMGCDILGVLPEDRGSRFPQNQGYWKNRPSQQLFKVFIYILYFAATCFGSRWPSSGGIHNYFQEATSLTTDPLFCVMGLIFCVCFGKYCCCLSNMWLWGVQTWIKSPRC
jgi:hypothetical protein